MPNLDEIHQDVTAETTVEGSVMVMLRHLAAIFRAAVGAGNDQAFKATADRLDASSGAMAAAVVANTGAPATQIPDVPAPAPPPPEDQPVTTPAVQIDDGREHVAMDASDGTHNGQEMADGTVRNSYFLPGFDATKPETH